jgi:hypothetical protein
VNEREMADAAYGKGWSKTVDDKLERIEKGVKKLGSDVLKAQEDDSKRYKNLEQRVEELEGTPRNGEDDDEITGVHSVEVIKRRARMMRARNRRWNRNAKIAAPGLVGVGVALAELVRQILAMRGH